MEFRVLGPLEVHETGESVPLGGKKQRSLLAILLLNANQVVSTDRLIDELWGGEAPETAQKALQVHVSQLRKVLEPERRAGQSGELLKTRSPGYVLELEPEQLDLGRFERLAAAGREALATGDPGTAAAKLREALSLWRGPPLAEFAYADFAQREISRLEELRLSVLEDRIQADLDCWATRRADRRARDAGRQRSRFASAPAPSSCSPSTVSGRQAEALDAYREARRALVEELGIEPSRGLKELEAGILEQDPALDLERPIAERRRQPAEVEEPADVGAPPGELFVGRERELTEFRAAFEDALEGRMSLFLIAGEPGIGKSRLADELASLARARGARVYSGHCWEAGGAPAYWPWVQALRAYIRDSDDERIREDLAPSAADIAQMLPELHDLFGDLAPLPSLDPEGARFRLFDSTASFLRAAGDTQPIVLILDDLQAADKPSLLLLQFLTRSLHDARIVLVGTYRDTGTGPDDPLSDAVVELRREPVTRAIRLGGLDVSEVSRVIELIASTRSSDVLAAAVHRETEGNPLFVGELVRLLDAEGRLEDAASATGALSIPKGLRDVIGHRLRHLSNDCKRLLSVAAVLGREFKLDALGRVSERADEELLDPLDEAQEARVVVDLPTGLGGLQFSHALIRDSLYGDLGTGERLRLHRRAADALEELYGVDREPHLAEIAYHSFEAAPGGDIDKAIDYARRAGDQAAALLAYEEATRLYRMALDALELKAPLDEATRCELLLALGDAEDRGGDLVSARETFARAGDVARRLDASEQLARAALGYGGRFVWFRAGKDRRLVPLLEDAIDALPDPGPLRARLLARLGGALRDHPVPDRRTSLTHEAVEIARGLGDPATLAYALAGSYAAICWPRDTEQWLAIGREMTELARESGNREDTFFGHLNVFGVFMVRGDIAAAENELGVMARLADELRQPAQQWAVSVIQGMLALFSGRLQDAERLMEQTGEVGSRAQGLDATFYYVMNLQALALRREQGRLAEIEAQFERFVGDYPNFIFRSALTSLYCDLGREDEARAELDRLAADDFSNLEVGTEWLLGAGLLAEVCASLGAQDHAVPLYEALLPYADHTVYSHIESARGSASRCLGLLAATMARWAEAGRHFERALEANARMGARPWVAHTQHDYARMRIRRGAPADERRAFDLLQAARAGYEELGMTTWQASATADLTSLA